MMGTLVDPIAEEIQSGEPTIRSQYASASSVRMTRSRDLGWYI